MEMAYSNRFAACVLVNGQIMKELPDGSIGLPFGSEYTLRLFNKHDRRAVAKISIDQENVSDGGFVVPAHGKIDIERRADRDSSFRFVELGSDAALLEGKPSYDPQGEMGVIQVDFHLEYPYTSPPKIAHPLPIRPQPYPYQPSPYRPHQFWYTTNSAGGTFSAESSVTRGMSSGANIGQNEQLTSAYCMSETSDASPINEATTMNNLAEGCTVEGHETGQDFSTVYIDYESACTSIMLYLQGYKCPMKVRQPRKCKARRVN